MVRLEVFNHLRKWFIYRLRLLEQSLTMINIGQFLSHCLQLVIYLGSLLIQLVGITVWAVGLDFL